MDITQLLAFSVKNKASDLHLSAGLPPMIRVHGDVRRINVDPLDHKQVHGMVYDIMNDSQRKAYEETLECDFSFEIQGLGDTWVPTFPNARYLMGRNEYEHWSKVSDRPDRLGQVDHALGDGQPPQRK